MRLNREAPPLVAVLLFFSAALLFSGCRRESAVPKSFDAAPVILISIDTLRSDRLPAYGYDRVATPNIDALAREGVLFEQAWSHCPMTLPSHVSMLTGLLPTEHGVRNNAGFAYDARKYVSLPQRLREKGYATGAAVSSYVLRGETGLREAFEFYDDAIAAAPGSQFAEHQRSGDATAAAAEKWLDQVQGKPFFLMLHLYEPHVPYAPPEPFRSRYADAYDGEIATADAILGSFLESLKRRGIYERAIIVLTSDHGEGLGDHGEQQHSILLYRELIQVPLIVRLPGGARAGERLTAPVGLNDIAPTIAKLTGVQMQRSAEAADLFDAPASRSIYAETLYPYLQLGWSDLRALVNERWQLIDGPKPELYDLRNDPKQTVSVLSENRRVASELLQKVRSYPGVQNAQSAIDPESASKLASLGYIGTVRTRPDPRSLPNPREVIGVLDEMQRAFALSNERKFGEAIPLLQSILERHPKMQEVRVKLAESLDGVGRRAEAIEAYRAALASSEVMMPELMLALGDLYVRSGKPREALEIAEVTRGALPAHALLLEARAELLRGNRGAALSNLEEAQRQSAQPLYGAEALRGELLAAAERPQEAIAAWQREVAAFPSNREALVRLAVAQFLSGDRRGMEATLRSMQNVDPQLAEKTRASLR